MKTKTEKRSIALAIGLALGLLCRIGLADFNSGSTGADGAFNPAADTELQLPPNGIFNFTSANIPEGVKITFSKNATNTPVVILVSGDFVLGGTIDISGTASSVTQNTEPNSGQPGVGGPGGYNGGRGGLIAGALTRRGGDGLGPGGGHGSGTLNVGLNSYVTGGGGGGFSDVGERVGNGGAGGSTYGSIFLLPLIGGSGGGGSTGGTSLGGSGGGGGGGAILIAVSGTIDIKVTGRILANGGNSGSVIGPNGTSNSTWGACGGGGSGGAIRIVATAALGSGRLDAQGGSANINCGFGFQMIEHGGKGSSGRIRIEAEKLSYGNSDNFPTPSLDFVTGPVFIPSQPSLRITSVGGIVAPSAPIGSMDIDLPATTTNPVTVVFASTGIPLGTTVTLTAKPTVGPAVTTISSPLTGSVDNATASANIDLPAGHSVLTATVSYTLTAALGDALGSQFAKGERVERIEVSAGMQSSSKVTLITVSGKRYPMSSPLQPIPAAG